MPKLTIEDLKKGGHAWNVYGDETKARKVYEKLTALGFKAYHEGDVEDGFLFEAAAREGGLFLDSDGDILTCDETRFDQLRQISDIPEPPRKKLTPDELRDGHWRFEPKAEYEARAIQERLVSLGFKRWGEKVENMHECVRCGMSIGGSFDKNICCRLIFYATKSIDRLVIWHGGNQENVT